MNSDRCNSHVALSNSEMLHTKMVYYLIPSVCARIVSEHMSGDIIRVSTTKLVRNYDN
jgi:hypothetical protein